MFWNFGGPSLSGITTALKSEDCQLETILSDSSLQQAIRNSLRELIDFITKEQIFNDLFDWVLTNKHKDNKTCQKLTRNALLILTTNSQQIQKAISNHQLFIQRIQSFIDQKPDDEPVNDARIAGHFQRITELYAMQTNGTLISQLKGLPTFLIHNMSIIGFRELFISLTTDYTENFGLTNEDIEELSKETNTENGYFVATAIRSILQQKPEEVIQYFQNPNVVKNLLEAAYNNKINHPLITIELSRILFTIVKSSSNSNDLKALLDEYKDKFIKEDMEINCSTAELILLFGSLNTSVFDHLFVKPVNTFLNQNIIKVLQDTPDEQKDILLKKFDAATKLLKSYCENTVNAQLYDLYDIIKKTYNLPTPELPQSPENPTPNENEKTTPNEKEKTTETETENSTQNESDKIDSKSEKPKEEIKLTIQLPEGWEEFTLKIEKEINILKIGYGGPLPTSSNTFSSDSDELVPEPSDSDEFEDDDEEDSEDPDDVEEEEEEEAQDKSDEEEDKSPHDN